MRFNLCITVAVAALMMFAAALPRLILRSDNETNLGALAWWYWVPFALLWLALTWLISCKARGLRSPGSSSGGEAVLVVAAALFARLIVACTAPPPQLSDDLWRYIHDGRTLAHGEHPYAFAPAEMDADPRINNRHLVTLYQPASLWTFAALAIVADGCHVPAHIVFRLGFVAFDLAIVLLLLRALRDAGRSLWWAALYAWHPLAISEVAGSGHQEPLGIALLLTALLLARQDRVTITRAVLAGAAFAAAIAVKPIVAPLAIPLAWSLRGHRRPLIVAASATLAMGAALYLPFALTPPGLERMSETASEFIQHWAFNSSIYALLPQLWADRLLVAVCALVIGVGMRWKLSPTRTSMYYLFAMLMFSSTVHPWYLLWALALLPLSFDPAIWVWSLTITASYYALRDRALWDLPTWVLWCEYVPVFALIAMRAIFGHNSRHDDTDMSATDGSTDGARDLSRR